MLHITEGNLLESSAEAIVNTVNTVGVMGKGIALQFKRAYPDNFKEYEAACRRGEVVIGRVLIHQTNTFDNPRFVINFPTKRHWRSRSKIEDIEAGLDDLKRVILEKELRSISVPPLGCGNGGLPWSKVQPLIELKLGDIPNVDVYVYAPTGTPDASSMPVRTKRPKLTRFGAAVLLAFKKYMALSIEAGLSVEPKLSMLEAHKVAYFLQVSGWPLRLNFDQGHYGPYAKDLDLFISSVEGHFIRGFGDGTGGAKATLTLDPSVLNEAAEMLGTDKGYQEALDRLESVVGGFEFPYGVELLSTVHYAASVEHPSDHKLQMIIDRIAAWSPRKRKLFRPEQAMVAYEHLERCDLIPR
ncbi:macro domain-containing protein [Actinophytocola sp.]|uniref:type II toxin-antitoxin system antitoxin DNA ADP-ribosyl glycohydrolase DarG n=1 Tax=Actinophytocola sp. TaxID=1872138 RepID=UPI00389B030D